MVERQYPHHPLAVLHHRVVANHVIHITDNGRVVGLRHRSDQNRHGETILLRRLFDNHAELHIQLVRSNRRILLAQVVSGLSNIRNHRVADLFLGNVQRLLLFREQTRNSRVYSSLPTCTFNKDGSRDSSFGTHSFASHF